jgi:hypothetical protein
MPHLWHQVSNAKIRTLQPADTPHYQPIRGGISLGAGIPAGRRSASYRRPYSCAAVGVAPTPVGVGSTPVEATPTPGGGAPTSVRGASDAGRQGSDSGWRGTYLSRRGSYSGRRGSYFDRRASYSERLLLPPEGRLLQSEGSQAPLPLSPARAARGCRGTSPALDPLLEMRGYAVFLSTFAADPSLPFPLH